MKRTRGGNSQQRFGMEKITASRICQPCDVLIERLLFGFSKLSNKYAMRYVCCRWILSAHIFNVEAVIFISCKPPVDPVELVVKYIKSVEDTGVSRTRCVFIYQS